jgi:hypothetical protein
LNVQFYFKQWFKQYHKQVSHRNVGDGRNGRS